MRDGRRRAHTTRARGRAHRNRRHQSRNSGFHRLQWVMHDDRAGEPRSAEPGGWTASAGPGPAAGVRRVQNGVADQAGSILELSAAPCRRVQPCRQRLRATSGQAGRRVGVVGVRVPVHQRLHDSVPVPRQQLGTRARQGTGGRHHRRAGWDDHADEEQPRPRGVDLCRVAPGPASTSGQARAPDRPPGPPHPDGGSSRPVHDRRQVPDRNPRTSANPTLGT